MGNFKTYADLIFGAHTKKRINYLFLAFRYNSPLNVKRLSILEICFDDDVANGDRKPAVTDVILK